MNHPNYVVCLFVTLYCVLPALYSRLPHLGNTEMGWRDGVLIWKTRKRRQGGVEMSGRGV